MRFLVTAGIYRASGASLSTIETVVEENPLSFATSRIVTIEACPWSAYRLIPEPYPSRLNSQRRLADTTLESKTSVKRSPPIRTLGRPAAGRRSRRAVTSFIPGSRGQPAKWRSGHPLWPGRRSRKTFRRRPGCAESRPARRSRTRFPAGDRREPASGRGLRESGCGLHAAQAVGESFGIAAQGRTSDAASGGDSPEHRPRLFSAE